MQRSLAASLALTALLLTGGCTTEKLHLLQMLPQASLPPTAGADKVLMVGTVEEGRKNTSTGLEPLVFRRALVESLKRSHMFKRVITGAETDADYELKASLLSQHLQSQVYTSSMNLIVRYELIDKRTAQNVWRDTIISEDSTAYGLALGSGRAKRGGVVEEAVKDNLTQLIQKLAALGSP